MIYIGEMTGQEIAKNRDGEKNVRLLKVNIDSDNNNETVELIKNHGEDSAPIKNSLILVIALENSDKLGLVLDDGIVPDMAEGEKKIYSINSGGAIAAAIKLLANGNVEINGNSKGVARLDDTTIVNGTTDATMIGWISAVTTFINGLAPGTIPTLPTTINGKINSSSGTVKTG